MPKNFVIFDDRSIYMEHSSISCENARRKIVSTAVPAFSQLLHARYTTVLCFKCLYSFDDVVLFRLGHLMEKWKNEAGIANQLSLRQAVFPAI
jgi:hypothetical protein